MTSDLRAGMKRLSKGLRDSLEATGAIDHALMKGEIREKEVIDGLRPHIPRRFEMATGQVVNAGGERSKQQDVIISDVLVGTPFLASGDIGVFPVEIVYASLQVRSRIGVSSIPEVIDNLASVKRLVSDAPRPTTWLDARGISMGQTTEKPFGGIIAFASESEPEKLQEAFLVANNEIPNPEDRANALVVVDELALNWGRPVEGGHMRLLRSATNATILDLVLEEPLLWFYLALRSGLARYVPPELDLFRYTATFPVDHNAAFLYPEGSEMPSPEDLM